MVPISKSAVGTAPIWISLLSWKEDSEEDEPAIIALESLIFTANYSGSSLSRLKGIS